MSAEPIRLEPRPGCRLRDLLFERGVEFPCGGISLCGGCKVRVREGDVPVTPEMRAVLGPEELADGWRLGCLAEADGPVTLEVEQWSVSILEDRAAVPFEPAEGRGAVVDLGTTTLVAQFVDRGTGDVLGVETALNPQGRHGADLMSRIHHDLEHPGELTRLIRDGIGAMLARLAGPETVEEVLIVGNTAMHHLFCGLSVQPLTAVPFRSPTLGAWSFAARELGWALDVPGGVTFLPCVGGFVGSDLLAGLVAIGLAEADATGALLDLGTNGEIAVGDRTGIVCASTAAGPAFEGGRIGMGMRAGTGAIDQVAVVDGALRCNVLGGVPARGICGSGLVDAVAAGLDLGWIEPTGRLVAGRKELPLCDGVQLGQRDIRELQLAKAAISAGLDILLDGRQLGPGRVHLGGAFGNYVRADSARRIGLLPAWAHDPVAEGNTALRGARRLLLAGPRRVEILDGVLARTTHLELASHHRFQDAFVDAIAFP